MEKTTLAIERTRIFPAMMKLLYTMIFICAIGMLIIMVIAVFMRYILHMDFFGYEDLELLFVIWSYYLGATYATYEETHIKGDMLSGFFKTGKQKKFYNISTNVFALLCMSIWVKWGYDWWIWNFIQNGKTTALELPVWMYQGAILFGICGLFIFSLFHVIKYIKMPPEEFLWRDECKKKAYEEGFGSKGEENYVI